MPPTRHAASPIWTGLFPVGVAVVTEAELGEAPALMPEERGFVARAVDKRVREFTTGRSCARAALARLGCPPVAISIGGQREPLWPPGIIGSITHCDGHCAAAVARCGPPAITSLGLDAEPALPLPAGVAHQVLTPAEQDWIARRTNDGRPWDRLMFSAKESVFKCLFPVERRFIEFHEVEIAFAVDDGFRIRAPGMTTAEQHLRGAYAFRDGLLLTTAIWGEGLENLASG